MGTGHLHAQYLREANPMKLSSMEALWETENPAPFAIMADINQEQGRNDFEIAVPALFSFMLYNAPEGEVKGINDLQKEAVAKYGAGDYRPDVTGLFWSFRIMVGVGGLMAFIAGAIGFLTWTDRLDKFSCVLKLLPWLLPLPFIANSVGWFIAEGGRQPWIVVGLQKTADAVSPNITGGEVWLTMIGFTVIYLLLAIAALYAAFRFINRTKVLQTEGRNG
jgi:cytochrome d ubiquinol oxidase subunit I